MSFARRLSGSDAPVSEWGWEWLMVVVRAAVPVVLVLRAAGVL